MTTADMLRDEGRVEGQLKGRRDGLLEQLEVKFGCVDPAVRARIEQAPLDQVTAWMRRFAVAASIGEVFDA